MGAVIMLLALAIWYVKSERAKGSYSGDAAGYYAYLPAIINDGDLSFSQHKQRENDHGIYANYRRESNGNTVNKYPVGTAILQAPAYMISHLFGLDEYSGGQQILHLLGALFFLLLGLYHLRKLSNSLGLNGDLAIVMSLSGNLIYYTIAEPFMSHVYGFSLVCILLSLLYDTVNIKELKHIPWMFLIIGFLIILRPTNVLLIAFLPFILKLYKSDFKTVLSLLRMKWYWFPLMLLPIGIQSILWYIGTGQFFMWSYPGEGFNWFSPHLMEVWISFKKGLFIYTPILLFSLAAFYRFRLFRQSQTIYWFAGLLIVSYVISCWWSWYYGDSFGHRAFIEFYPVLIIPALILFSNSKNNVLIWTSVSIVFLFGLLQNWQYDAGIIHPNSMSLKKYKSVLFKTGSHYKAYLGNEQEVPPHGVELKLLKHSSIDEMSSEGKLYMCETTYSSKVPAFATIRCSKTSDNTIDYRSLKLVAQGFDTNNEQVFLQQIPYYDIADEGHGEWVQLETKIVIQAAPTVKLYIYNPEKLSFRIKNYSVTINQCIPID